jgi:beta-lactamase superfamily II metal-dependent hydrolase
LYHLDYFVLSHAHDDHAGGALAVAQYLYEHGGGIDVYYRSSYIASSKQAPLFEEYLKQKGTHIYENVLAGYQWTIGDVRITAYHPTTEDLEKCVGNGASEDRGVARFENADRTIRNRSGFRIENTAPDNEAFLGKTGNIQTGQE